MTIPTHPTTLIGRDAELAEISSLLALPECRLLTLTGSGGMGKTRLALEAANRNLLPDGAVFVSLQPLSSAEAIVPTIADALKFAFFGEHDSKTQLLHYLREKQLLLVLDNFEQLLDGTDLLPEILNAAAGIKILATSRERLNLREEWVLDIRGLAYPEQEPGHPLNSYSAVVLFTQSARRAGYMPQDQDSDSIIRICRSLEGVPLAIELAAGWARAMSCQQIADEIEHSLDILSSNLRNVPERHRSMRAAFEHSWVLLTADEKNVFMKLSVFRGGFTRNAAESVAGASLSILVSLVDKSLLRVAEKGRYDLHELLRQFGAEQLEAAGEAKATSDAHSRYYAEFLAERESELEGAKQLGTVAEINADFENIRIAWNWTAHQHDELTAAKMLRPLAVFDFVSGKEIEVFELFEYAEAFFAPQQGESPGKLWGRLLARSLPRDDKARLQHLETALKIAEQYNDPGEMAFCLWELGRCVQNHDNANELRLQSLQYYREIGDRFFASRVLYDMSVRYGGTWENCLQFGKESLQLCRESGDRVGIAWTLFSPATNEAREGRFLASERLWLERIAIADEMGHLWLSFTSSANLFRKVYFIQGDFDNARVTVNVMARQADLVDARATSGWAWSALGLLNSMEENYEEAMDLCLRALATLTARFSWMIDFVSWGVAVAACGLGDDETARQHFPMAFNFWKSELGLMGQLVCLPIPAILHARSNNLIRAVELLALAYTYPLNASGWMKKWPLLARLQAQLEESLGEEAYTAAWDRGKRLDAETVMAGLLAELESPASSSQLLMVDLLSKREQEIARLVLDGHSNREIADKLFLSLETIRWYLKEIYSKLDVHSREELIQRFNP